MTKTAPQPPPPEKVEKPYLPNIKSRQVTSASMLFDLHYAKLGIHRRWTPERYIRLAAFCGWTPYELASWVAMPHAEVDRFLERGGRIVGPAAVLLTMREHDAMNTFTKDTISPLPI